MYPPHHLGGYELIWRAGAAAVRDRGHEVGILTTDYRSPAPDPSIPEDPGVQRELRSYWRDHDFPRLSPRERTRLERHNASVFDRRLEQLRPDVVSWWAMGGMSLSLIERARRRGLPAVGFVHDDWLLYGPRVDQWLRLWRRLRPLAGTAERVTRIPTRLRLGEAANWVFVSETTRRRALDGGWELPRTGIVHSGVELERFPLAAESGWSWRLLYAGRIDPRKGVETAIRALALLPHEATLTVSGAGDPGYLARLHELVRELGLERRVSFTVTPRDELAALYARAGAVVFPVDWEEPWGLVPIESMAVGRPVIASGRGGSGEYLSDGDNALLYTPPASAEALAAAVRRLAGDGELRARLRAGGRRTAERITARAFAEAAADAIEAEA
jgi:glycosyltransferase involved in cell wall biosynthesis